MVTGLYLYSAWGGYKGKVRANINLLITFLLSGLWHGANVTYLLWGGIWLSWCC